ncbi:MAG: hypothetical protein [Caudoviricetes sp.]|nr:MAG: hypothetical protein [Caudoviricetes sp.]
MKQSSKLTKFYNEYYNWILSDNAHHDIFYNSCGLCHNLLMYCNRNGINKNLVKEMKKQFKKAKLDALYPFGKKQYITCKENNNFRRGDANRIAWVKSHLKKKIKKKFTPISEI